jgi:nucleoid DNA-binding protein
MNKAQIIQNIAKGMTISKASAERTVNAFLDEIKKGVKKEKSVQLVGFGTFKVRSRKARTGRNPKTGERIKIKASRTVGFKAGRPFKASI